MPGELAEPKHLGGEMPGANGRKLVGQDFHAHDPAKNLERMSKLGFRKHMESEAVGRINCARWRAILVA